MRGLVLTELANVLRDQGKYSQARKAYEEALEIAKQLGDLRSQGVKSGTTWHISTAATRLC